MLLTLLQNNATPLTTKVWINVSSVWKEATPYIKVTGVWKVSTANIKIAGVWR